MQETEEPVLAFDQSQHFVGRCAETGLPSTARTKALGTISRISAGISPASPTSKNNDLRLV